MTGIIMPSQDQLSNLVAPLLKQQPSGLCIAIGCVVPSSGISPQICCFGSGTGYFGNDITFNETTPFLIASLTKTFTATLYAWNMMAHRSASLGSMLNVNQNLAGITLDSLVNYTSGLPDDNYSIANDTISLLPIPYTSNSIASYILYNSPSLTINTYQYSNLGFAIIGAVMASSSSTAFEDLMTQNLLQPLSIGAQFFGSTQFDQFPSGYTYNYDNSPPYTATRAGWEMFPAYDAAGGLVATSDDMMNWLNFVMGVTMGPDYLNTALTATLTQSTDIVSDDNSGHSHLGLAWFLSPQEGALPPTTWKDGGLGGTSTYILFNTSSSPGTVPSDAGVYVMMNASEMTMEGTSDGSDAVAYLAYNIMHLMYGISETPSYLAKRSTGSSRRATRQSGASENGPASS